MFDLYRVWDDIMKFDGKKAKKELKVIVYENLHGDKNWMEKPKNKDIETTHFKEVNCELEVHQDSSDGMSFRAMRNPIVIGSGCPVSGDSFFYSAKNDIVIVPMQDSLDGYELKLTPSGDTLRLPDSGWCLFAIGKFGKWQKKP